MKKPSQKIDKDEFIGKYKPILKQVRKDPPLNILICGRCHGAKIRLVFKFCPYCGKEIDWS